MILEEQFLRIFLLRIYSRKIELCFALPWEITVKITEAQRRDIWVSVMSPVTHLSPWFENQTALVLGDSPLTFCEYLGLFRP